MDPIPATITDLRPDRPDEDDHDDVILSVDEDGIERLRFVMPCGDRQLLCQFPRHGEWNDYIGAVSRICSRLSSGIKDITVPELVAAGGESLERAKSFVVLRSQFLDFWELAAETIRLKGIAVEIENSFWEFFRPTMKAEDDSIMDEKSTRKYFNDNADAGAAARFFIAFVNVDEILKKNVISSMKRAFQPSGKSSSGNSSRKNSDTAKPKFTPRVNYE